MAKNKMGPATSLSSMICWSILPNGFRTASVYFQSALPSLRLCIYGTYLHLNMPEVHSQFFHCTLSAYCPRVRGYGFTNVAAVHLHICTC